MPPRQASPAPAWQHRVRQPRRRSVTALRDNHLARPAMPAWLHRGTRPLLPQPWMSPGEMS
ncbi:hypothetical protein BGLA2_990079 [Burkholderia gladioli]|nr:hypothetical protein BGLA2_990079 [Burkholderia gladioli]